jgi:hypothetical protein
MTSNLSRRRTRRPTLNRALATAVVLGTLGGGLGLHVSTAGAAPPQLCTAKPSFFDPQIKATYDQWGGTGGKLGCALNDAHISPDGRAVLMDFRGGTITWRNQDIPPTVVLAEIRDKWYALGGGASALSYPRSNTFAVFTPDGELGMANEFEQGAGLYFAPSTGAHEVHGSIGAYHTANFATLGFPTSDEQDFTEGGKVSYFQHGAVYWWPDTGVLYVPRGLVVGYMGLIADSDTNDQGGSDDEPYVTVGAITPRTTVKKQTPVYGSVDSGDSRKSEPVMELYRGAPEGITLTAVAMEHDGGTPEAALDVVAAGLSAGAVGLAGLVAQTPVVGPGLAVAAAGILLGGVPAITDAIGSAISDIFGLGEDEIGRQTIPVSAKQMITYAAAPNQSDHGIKYKFQSESLHRTGSYRLLFAIWKESA